MKRFLLLLTAVIGSYFTAQADSYNLGEVVEFYAWNNDCLCQESLGDWSLAFYREDVDYHVLEIDIHNGDSHRIAGSYTLDSDQYEMEVVGYASATMGLEDGSTVAFSEGTVEVTYVGNRKYDAGTGEKTYPVYHLVGSFVNDEGDTVEFDYEIPCTSAIDYGAYMEWYQGSVWIDYHMVLLDDPDAVDPNYKHEPTGEKKFLRFDTEFGYRDYTSPEGGYWQVMACTANMEYLISLSPASATSLAGAYSASDMYKDYTYMERHPDFNPDGEDKQTIFFQSGEIVVTNYVQGPVFEANLLGYDGVWYEIIVGDKNNENSVEEISSAATTCIPVRKQIKDRQVIIIKDGKVFSVNGVENK